MTARADVDLAVEAMRIGAYDFIEKPYPPTRLISMVQHALEKRRLTQENRALKRETGGHDTLEAHLIGRSDAMVALRKTIRTIAATSADVLVTGPIGAGKDLAARAIYDLSVRAAHPFVHIKCATLPVDLVEAELFGHEGGAFCGGGARVVRQIRICAQRLRVSEQDRQPACRRAGQSAARAASTANHAVGVERPCGA